MMKRAKPYGVRTYDLWIYVISRRKSLRDNDLVSSYKRALMYDDDLSSILKIFFIIYLSNSFKGEVEIRYLLS